MKIDSAVQSDFKWKMFKDDQLRLFPNIDRVLYFSNNSSTRYMPHNLISESNESKQNSDGRVIVAPKKMVDIFDRHSIILAGMGIHHNGYYHSRCNPNFTDFICVFDGAMEIKFGKEKKKIKRGEAFILPPNQLADSFVISKETKVFWVHFKNIQFWNEVFGKKPFVKKLDSFESIYFLANLYRDEVFSQNPSVQILESTAELMVLFFKREFGVRANRVSESAFEKFLKRIEESLDEDLTASSVAREMGISRKALDMLCLKNRLLSFPKLLSKMRMKKALDMLKSGESNQSVARAVGYSNAFAFSKAFKLFYGKSPKKYLFDF